MCFSLGPVLQNCCKTFFPSSFLAYRVCKVSRWRKQVSGGRIEVLGSNPTLQLFCIAHTYLLKLKFLTSNWLYVFCRGPMYMPHTKMSNYKWQPSKRTHHYIISLPFVGNHDLGNSDQPNITYVFHHQTSAVGCRKGSDEFCIFSTYF
jgi:hypothetical protein